MMNIMNFVSKNSFYLYGEIMNKTDDFNKLIKSIPFISKVEERNLIKFSDIDNYKNGYIKVVIDNLRNMRLEIGFNGYKGDLFKVYKFNDSYEFKFSDENKFYKCKTKIIYDNENDLGYEVELIVKLNNDDKFSFPYFRRIFYDFFNKNSKNIKRGYYYNNLTFNFGNDNRLDLNCGYEFGYLTKKKNFKVKYRYYVMSKIYNRDILKILNFPKTIDLYDSIYIDDFNNLIDAIKNKLTFHNIKSIKLIKNVVKLKTIMIII